MRSLIRSHFRVMTGAGMCPRRAWPHRQLLGLRAKAAKVTRAFPLSFVGAVLMLNPFARALEPGSTNSAVPVISGEYGVGGLRMNFRGAPLSLVLDYLSEAAGFIINKQTPLHGTVEVWSKQPVGKDEAIELLGSVLKQNGYALTRNGRLLTIFATDSVKTADTEIVVNSDPEAVQKSDAVQTQIIPVRYATANQLVQNLQPLLPTTATLSANESANTLILVATKTEIKRALKIVSALDHAMAAGSVIKVRPLRYADAKDTANLITQLFTQPASTQNQQAGSGNFGFGGGPGGGPFGGGPPERTQAGSGSGSSARGSLAGRVIAVADDRSNSVVLSATPDLLASLEAMVDQLDQPFSESTELRVFHLTNAEPSELAEQLAQLFPDPTSLANSQNNNLPMFFPGPPGSGNPGNTGGSSQQTKKSSKVLTVADPRTASLIVIASKSLMPQIAQIVTTLDADRGRREIVSYFELRNADPQDISQNLQDLFNRSTVRAQNDSQNSFLGRNHPLSQRQTQNQQANSTTTSPAAGGLGSQSGGGLGRLGQ